MTRNVRHRSRFAKLVDCMRAFQRDEQGSVTIQVIFFSLMVFGATGVVLDAGRVYDTHSVLQIYADSVATAAANELDRKEDSIERATTAVYSSQGGTAGLIAGSDANAGTFKVAKLEFYSGMNDSNAVQNDMSEAFPDTMLVGTTTSTSSDATPEGSEAAAFVVVTVSADVSAMTRIVTQTIPDLGHDSPYNAGAPYKAEQIGPTTYDLQVKAAATLERESCAELTTLVMCNPWEDQTGSADALSVEKDDPNYSVPGRSLMFFAPNFQNALVPSDRIIQDGEAHGSLFPWDVNHQLFQIDTPVADPAGVCSDGFLRNLAGDVVTGDATSQEYIEARDRCLMARAEAAEVCWSDENPLTIRPADGGTVLRSVNTIFDIWNAPFDTQIQDATQIDPTGALPFTAADFFQPDRLATTTYETADRFGPDTTGVHACSLATDGTGAFITDPVTGLFVVDDPRLVQDGIPDYNQAFPCDVPELDPALNPTGTTPLPGDATYVASRDESHPDNATPDSFQPAYDTVPSEGWSYMAGTRGEGIGYDFCHDKTLGRQDTARQELALCETAALSAADPVAAAAQCLVDYDEATNFDTCAAQADPGRETAECGCAIDFVGDHHQGGSGLYMFARTRSYRNSLYDFGGQNPNNFMPITISGGPLTWYEFYTAQRDLQTNFPNVGTNGDRSRVARWNGTDPVAPGDPQNAVADYAIDEDPNNVVPSDGASVLNHGYQKHYPDDFFALTNQDPSGASGFNLSSAMRIGQNRERRRIQAAMVNCAVVTGQVPDSDGNTRAPNDAGTFDVTLDDLRVMDSYIPNPAGMFCGPDSVDCSIAQSVETSMYIELIEEVDATTDQYTVRLVR